MKLVEARPGAHLSTHVLRFALDVGETTLAHVRDDRILSLASKAAATWAFGYALYRLYYAAGGDVGMFGTPVSYAQWRLINGIAGIALLAAAVFPVLSIRAWLQRRATALLLALSWVVTVGCIMRWLAPSNAA